MNFLSKLRVNAKFGIILGLSAMAVVVTIAAASFGLHKRMISDRTAELAAVLDNVQAYAAALEKEVSAGHITREEAIKRFTPPVRAMRFAGGSGYVIGARIDGIFFLNPVRPELEGTVGSSDASGKPIIQRFIDLVRDRDEATLTYDYPKPNKTEPLTKLALVRRFRPWDVVFSTGIWIDDIERDYRAMQRMLILAGLGIVAISGAATFLVGADIVRPLRSLRGRMAAIAGGELNGPVPEAMRGDEIGGMARALQTFQQKAIALQDLQASQDGLKAAAEAERRRAMVALADRFEASVQNISSGLSAAAGRMQASARSMTELAAGSRTRTSAVVSAAREVSSNVGTVAAAAEELSVSSREIGRQVEQASAVAKRAVEESQRTNVEVAALSETARQIDEVVNLINSIAGQTNLLALNATIEAARAGEAGKGFAVVASEVKSLATQTARATEEIRAKIQAVQSQSAQAVAAIRAIGGTIDGLNVVSAAIAAAVEQQSAATGEITSNIQSASVGTQDVSVHVASIGTAAEATGSSADEVLAAAEALARQADVLGSEVNGFLTTIRAA